MKLNRIVLKRTNKTNGAHSFLKEVVSGLLFVFLLPYVCACLWGYVGEEKALLGKQEADTQSEETASYEADIIMDWGVWKLPLEEYLVYKLAAVMPENYEKDALMAQAILLRTEFIRQARERETNVLLLEEKAVAKWYGSDEADEMEVYEAAVEATKDIYLCYEGEPILVSYFKVSNGRTRNVSEVWHTRECPYLSGTVSGQDKSAAEYETTVTVSKKEYLRKMRSLFGEAYTEEELWGDLALIYDSAGYVTTVFGECDGERFRRLFDLNSASFTVEWEEDQVNFYVTGVGHGFGMSQYGANCKAINGENYQEILRDYFSGTELAKIE